MTNSHSQKIIELKKRHEKAGYSCLREVKVFRKDLNKFTRIDLCCWHSHPKVRPNCFEFEHSQTPSSAQYQSNKKDLELSKRIFGAKICQFQKDIRECEDFKNVSKRS